MGDTFASLATAGRSTNPMEMGHDIRGKFILNDVVDLQ
jgi:hypothetical protein